MVCTRGALGALLAMTIACGGRESSRAERRERVWLGRFGDAELRHLTAVIDGAAYAGVINAATNTNGTLRISSNSTDLTRSVNFAAPGAVGTTTVFLGSAISFNVITTTGGAVIGSWGAGGQLGSGTLTITSLTASGASGTFSFSVPPGSPRVRWPGDRHEGRHQRNLHGTVLNMNRASSMLTRARHPRT